MLHHDLTHLAGLHAERRAEAARRRPPADPGELERVVIATRAGDRTALALLIDRFGDRVRRVAGRYRLGAHDADDVIQTTWLRLLERGDTIRDPNAVGSWLETTARHECLRVLRGAARERPVDDAVLDHEAESPVDDERLVREEQRAALDRAVAKLPRRQRELVDLLRSAPEASYAEISRALGMPIGSIGPTRIRCLANLRADAELVSALRP
jgi:RNA polymerase sigma factor (sigma-70 family)